MTVLSHALASLKALLPQHVDASIASLARLVQPAAGIAAVKKYFPEDFERELAGNKYDFSVLFNTYDVEDFILQIIGRYIPVMDGRVDVMEESHNFIIAIEPLGPQWGWESLDQALTDLNDAGQGAGPDLFIQACNVGMDDETWQKLIDHFRWPIQVPSFPTGGWYWDEKEFFLKLRAAELHDLVWLWRVNIWETGNIFFDLNLEDEQPQIEWNYSIEEMPMLIKHAEQAKKISKKYHSACDQVLSNPGLIQTQLDLFLESIHANKNNRP